METKKTLNASLEKKSKLFLAIGFLVACTLSYFAINLKSERIEEKAPDIVYKNNEEPVIRIEIEEPEIPEPEPIEQPVLDPPKVDDLTNLDLVDDSQNIEKNDFTPTDLPAPLTHVTQGSKTTTIVKPVRNIETDIIQTKDKIERYNDVSVKPIFPGCDGKEGKELDLCNSKVAQKSLLRGLEYPEDAIKEERQGTAYIRFIVSKKGRIQNVSILRSSRHEDLDEAASEAVSKIFTQKRDVIIPGKDTEGESVNVEYQVPVKFRLAE